MRHLLPALAGGILALTLPAPFAHASIETEEARQVAADAAQQAHEALFDTFGSDDLQNGRYKWRHGAENRQINRVVISLTDQLVYAYDGDQLIAVSTISSGKPGKDTPSGIFSVLEKQRLHRSVKYDDAPMPFMQRIDDYGIALHAGNLPGYPASHGCVRLPPAFAAKLFGATQVGTKVLIGE